MKKELAIIGGGAACLALASFIDYGLYNVTIYEANAAMGRKFLVAGKGGFNLTHGENIELLKGNFTPAGVLDKALDQFSNVDFRKWLLDIGIPTYVGSSNRVFPEKGIKPIDVFSAIKRHIESKGVIVKTKMRWSGWSEKNGGLTFDDGSTIAPNVTVFSLGGGSWSKTGSDGQWMQIFRNKGLETLKFQPANCGYLVDWNPSFIEKAEGQPLKNIKVISDQQSKMGELMITSKGIEGSAIYSLTNTIRRQLDEEKMASLFIDLKPMIDKNTIYTKMRDMSGSMSSFLQKTLKLEKVKIQLLKAYLTKEEYLDARIIIEYIKRFPLDLIGTDDIDKAISTTGGLPFVDSNSGYQIAGLTDSYAIGEMLDWNAPTGGYLLQGCFSMGHHLASYLNEN